MGPSSGRWAVIVVVAAQLVAACSPSPARTWPVVCPKPRHNLEWQLDGLVDASVDAQVYEIDMNNSPHVVAAVHARGRRVFCYSEAGTRQDWRWEAGRFPVSVLGRDYVGWPSEPWLDIGKLETIGPIMSARLDQCRAERIRRGGVRLGDGDPGGYRVPADGRRPLVPFVPANKAMFNAEYNLDTFPFCSQARQLRFSSIKKRLDLGGAWREPC